MVYPIELSASYEKWKTFWLRRNHPRFKEVAKKIFERDQHTCQFCTFAAPIPGFEIINLDQNYRNNKSDNLVTACPLCSQCFFMESIGIGSFGGGSIIYLPEMTQNQLNALCHQLFITISKKDANSGAAENLLRDYKFRTSDVEKIFGDGSSDPAYFGTLLLTANLAPEEKQKIVGALRILPVRTRFVAFTEASINVTEPRA